MQDEDNIDEFNFQADDAEKGIVETIDTTLSGQLYNEDMVPHWIDKICEKVMSQLVESQKPYKYMVNCMIMQRNGAGAFTAASTFWDGVIDGCAIVKWPKDKESKGEAVKNQLNCIVTVFASNLNPNH